MSESPNNSALSRPLREWPTKGQALVDWRGEPHALTSEPPDDKGGMVSTSRSLFSFLEERGASVEVEHHGDQTVIAYIDDPATFEVELDWLECAAFVLV